MIRSCSCSDIILRITLRVEADEFRNVDWCQEVQMVSDLSLSVFSVQTNKAADDYESNGHFNCISRRAIFVIVTLRVERVLIILDIVGLNNVFLH
ncbi:hypothetical protein M513_03260 [Trichuris suis]|uniref:Uncharacterized protein n=1 Tax=Trichuris suis TaxID=68888 RepID=A0A085MF25_9BILA|nr:hypothetical protein M513_03260 [Trichuris suis]